MIINQFSQDSALEAGTSVTGGQSVVNPWCTIGGKQHILTHYKFKLIINIINYLRCRIDSLQSKRLHCS
jgi:hypothetical protein